MQASNEVTRFNYKVPEKLSDFDPEDFIKRSDEFFGSLEKGSVLISASGGVDSTVAAFLLKRVFDDELNLFFIDDGFRRIIKGVEESQITANIFKDFENFEILNVRDKFLPLFNGLSNGERKRKVFREIYSDVSNSVIEKLGCDYIADGTIRPDILETVGNVKIKTQHNIDLPYKVQKLEPLSSLSKPHVRRVGKCLGLSDDVVYKIPCPGPAQLIRVVGEVNNDKLEIAKIATDIVEQSVEEYCENNFGSKFKYDEKTGVRYPFQMFGVALDNWLSRLNGIDINEEYVSCRSRKEIICHKMINRSTYIEDNIKKSGPLDMPIIFLEPIYLEGIDLPENKIKNIEEGIQIGKNVWTRFGYPRLLYQVFDSGKKDDYIVAIRSVESDDAIKARPMKIDLDYLHKIGKKIAETSGNVSRVAYDISIKPPATIEFE